MPDQVPTSTWRRSTFCADSTCVEVAWTQNQVLVRDAKNPAGPSLAFDETVWQQFIRGIKSGDFEPH